MTKKLKYAGFWRRLSASLIDILITMPIIISLSYLFGLDKYVALELDENIQILAQNPNAIFFRFLVDVISVIILAFYSVLFITSNKRATIGKMVFDIQVVDVNGNKLTKMRALMRFLSSIILTSLTLGIGLIMIAFTKEKTSLYDLVCSTRVIKK